MKFNLKRAVETLSKKDLKFLQPMYEAITNSLEANATSITIDIESTSFLSDEFSPKVTGFTITDNGDGFTQKNIDSFLELWTDAKIEYGCKGSGRFTWLNVFNTILIKSFIVSEEQRVEISFNLQFDENRDIKVQPEKIQKNETIIEFNDITKKYFDSEKNFDARAVADIDDISREIEKNLLVKLFLIKRKNKKFLITIRMNNAERKISDLTIPTLSCKPFNIYSDLTKESYSFLLYYHFINNNENSKKIYYCAHDRTVKEEDDDALHFSCALPQKTSFNMLLCSKYLDEMVNDSRDDFPALSDKKQASYACPLRYKDIKPHLLNQMQSILMERFPELEQLNKEQEQIAIETSPYLTKYIKEIDDIVKTEKSLTTKALDAFAKHKIKVKNKFDKLLNDKCIDVNTFESTVQEFSEVAAAELGEYILYRQSIIKALDDATLDKTKDEKFIHNIFMPQRKSIAMTGNEDYSLTNLWLLDDKFMTFSSAYSDVTIKKIVEDIFFNKQPSINGIGMDNKKPDLAVFYNKDVSNDVLVFEFKNPHAALGEKEKSIAELNRNCLLLKEKIKEINTVWAYIITSIDYEFEFALRANGYKRRFTNASNGKIFYSYNEEIGHLFALDIEAITADAFARNKTFLDILKHNI